MDSARLHRVARAVLPRRLRRRTFEWWTRARARTTARVALRGRRPPLCDSIDEWVASHPGTECRVLYPTRTVFHALPRTVEPVVPRQYVDRQGAVQHGRSVVTLHGARLVGPCGLVVLPDGKVASESVYGRSVVEERDEIWFPWRRPRSFRSGRYFSLVVIWSRQFNYYHWVHDTLTRLHGVVDEVPPDTRFIIPANANAFQRETLHTLGIDDDRLVPFSGDEIWELETLYFAQDAMHSNHDRREVDLWLRDRFLTAYGITPAADGSRIFLTRRADQRRLLNEPEVEALLRDHGFTRCVAEQLPHREQVARFARAEAVVGMHGAGLTNILFAPEGLKVLDMNQEWLLHNAPAFWSMAQELGHEYWYLEVDSVPRPGYQPDASVPIDKLAATIEQMGLGPR